MSADDPKLDPDKDCFKPPAIPTLVGCLHCQQEYDSYLIEWRVELRDNGKPWGYWGCPTPGCDGKGFGFDILPADPEWRDEDGNGWYFDDEDDDGDVKDESLWEDDNPPNTDNDEASSQDESDSAKGDKSPSHRKPPPPIDEDEIPY